MISLRFAVCASTLAITLPLAACGGGRNNHEVGQPTTSGSPAVASEEASSSAGPADSDYISSAKPIDKGVLPSAPPQDVVKPSGAPPESPADARAGLCEYSLKDYGWHCHIPRPSIPRIHVEGPRPPLTPKSSAWCTQQFVYTSSDVVWSLRWNTKVPIRFWPDYYHRTYQLFVWNWDIGDWYWQPDQQEVDCDA